MFSFLVWFISSIIETSVVDFQLPVGPVTKYNHFFFFSIFFLTLLATFKSIISSNFIGVFSIFLITTQILQVFKNALTLYAVPSLDT
jgi:hypothetical protein